MVLVRGSKGYSLILDLSFRALLRVVGGRNTFLALIQSGSRSITRVDSILEERREVEGGVYLSLFLLSDASPSLLVSKVISKPFLRKTP